MTTTPVNVETSPPHNAAHPTSRLATPPEPLMKCATLAAHMSDALRATADGRPPLPSSLTPLTTAISPSTETLHVAAGFHRHVHDDAPGAHRFNHVAGHDHGRPPAEYLRGRNDDVRIRHDPFHAFLPQRRLLQRQFAGIAPVGPANLSHVDLDEYCAQRAHLLRHRRSRIERLYPGAPGVSPSRSPADRPRRHR